jgi:hypothetical protein
MRNDDLMTRARSANPVPPATYQDWSDTAQGREVVERILAVPGEHGPRPRRKQRADHAARSRLRSAWAGAVAALILGIVVILTIPQSGPRTGSAWAAPLVKIAEGAPRFLVTEEGWKVVRADEFSGEIGEMTFANGTSELDLSWVPAAKHDAVVEDREQGAEASWKITIAGQDAVLFQYEGTTDFTAHWRDGDHSLQLRGVFPSVDDYRAVAASLEPVDVDTWLSAMPESVVRPTARAASVEAMLADIPVHPRVDVERLKSSGRVSDRYQLGAAVTGAVACAWLEQWVDATAKGDEAPAQEAVDAMATSHDWAILLEMDEEGDWPEAIWQYTDAMQGNDPIPQGRIMTIEESYQSALGC